MIPGSRVLRSVVPSSRALHALDIALGLWVLAWIGLGVAIGINISDLSGLSHTAVISGRAVQTVGRSLGVLGAVPLVGGSLSGVAGQVQAAGASAVSAGHSSLSSIHALSVLLAIAVALLPSVPVFGFYLPVRLDLRREADALHRATVSYGRDPGFRAFLARRAIDSLGYHRLRGLAARPWEQALSETDCSELAAAELRRLGIDPRLIEDPTADAQTDSRGGAPAGGPARQRSPT
jgi:hypothetical protein